MALVQFGNCPATIVRIADPLPNLRVITVELEHPVPFQAGQYMSIIVPGKRPAPFSIASSPADPTRMEFGVSVIGGPVTTALKQAQPGDMVTLRGPFGRFVMEDEPRICFLAGGVGITPLMSMLRWIRDAKLPVQAVMIYSCRELGQFLWKDELLEMQRTHPNIRVVLTCTGSMPQWPHERGRIDAALISRSLPEYKDYAFYACGPDKFIDDLFGVLRGLGVHEMKLKKESW